jgi:hypothetical protein
MNVTGEPVLVFLGAGGAHPRVDAWNVDSGEIHEFVEFPPMHSAYAIGVNWETGTLAVGTKGGLIYLIDSAQNQGSDKPVVTRKLLQGAPLVSACWVSASLVAASDTAGRCLLWRTDADVPPRPFYVGEGIICSLVTTADELAAGLSSEGKIIFWRIPEGRLVQTVKVPAPPPMSALVRMVYWPSRNVFICPGAQGSISLYDLERDCLTELHAHQGALYAISPFDECLVTAGIEDHRLKVWPPDCDRPTYDFRVQERFISAGEVCGWPPKLLLIELHGSARTYMVEGGELLHISRLAGSEYRVVAAFPSEELQALYARKKHEEVHRIVTDIRYSEGRASEDAVNGMHGRLIDMGYEPVSLALRAEQAEQKGDIVEGLKLRSALIQMLPEDHPNACPSMERYASLCEKAWQVNEAVSVYQRIRSTDPTFPILMRTTNLAQMAALVAENHWVIEPDIELEVIIASATALGKRFFGRYMIKKLGPEPCGSVTSEAVVEKYEQVGGKSRDKRLPAAVIERIWWLSRAGADEIDLITFGDGQTNGIKGLQVALQVLYVDLDTVLIPTLLFDWRETRGGQSTEEEDECVRKALADLRKKDVTNAYLSKVLTAVNKAVRRLVTEGRSQWGRRG